MQELARLRVSLHRPRSAIRAHVIKSSGGKESWCCELQMLDYNVPGGKLNRGMAVLDALRALRGDDEASCAELAQNNIQIAPLHEYYQLYSCAFS